MPTITYDPTTHLISGSGWTDLTGYYTDGSNYTQYGYAVFVKMPNEASYPSNPALKINLAPSSSGSFTYTYTIPKGYEFYVTRCKAVANAGSPIYTYGSAVAPDSDSNIIDVPSDKTISYNNVAHTITGSGWTYTGNYNADDTWFDHFFLYAVYEKDAVNTTWTKKGEIGGEAGSFSNLAYTIKSTQNVVYLLVLREEKIDTSGSAGNSFDYVYTEPSSILTVDKAAGPTISLVDSVTASSVDSVVINVTTSIINVLMQDSATTSYVDSFDLGIQTAPATIQLDDSITYSSVSIIVNYNSIFGISGKVVFANSSPVIGATIFAIEVGTNRVFTTTTDDEGNYLLTDISLNSIYHVSCVYQDEIGNKYTSLTQSYVS